MEKNRGGLSEEDFERLFMADDSEQPSEQPKATPPKPDFKSLAAGEREDHIQEKPQQLKMDEGLLASKSFVIEAMAKAHTTARQMILFPSDEGWFRELKKILHDKKT